MVRKNDVSILIVDDEDYMREVVRQALEGAGFPIQARGYKQRAGIIRALMEED